MAGLGVQLLVNLAFILGADGFRPWSSEWRTDGGLSNSSFRVGSTWEAILGSFDVGLFLSTLAPLKGARSEGPTYYSDKKLDEFYEIQEEEVLGRGTYALDGVKVATNKLDGKKVAVKQMHTADPSHGVAYNELSILQLPAMQHISGICHLEAAFYDPETHLMSLVLELASGAPLTEWWKSQSEKSHVDDYSAALPLIEDMLVTLVALHEEAKVCHGDIKPDNWRCADADCSHTKLLDFGFSQQIGDLKSLALSVKQGTPAYAAHELLIGNKKYDERVDIWAFGSMVQDLFTPSLHSHLKKFASTLMEVTLEDRPGAREALDMFRHLFFNFGERTGGDLARSHGDRSSGIKRVEAVDPRVDSAGLAGLGMSGSSMKRVKAVDSRVGSAGLAGLG